MLILVTPLHRAFRDFPKNQQALGFSALFLLTLATVTTGCSSLNAGNSASNTTTANSVSPIVMSAALPPATIGSAYNAVITVRGGSAPYSFAVRSGKLPPGLSLQVTSGSISGHPKRAGSYSFTIAVADHARTAAGLKKFAINVSPPQPTKPPVQVAISPATYTLPAGGSHQFVAQVSNASSPKVTWAASAGTITATGLFTAPNVNAPATVQVTAISNADPSKHGTATVSVSAPTVPTNLSLANTSLPDAIEGIPYSTALQLSGGTAPYHWKIASGPLPGGFVLDASAGVISGIASESGTFSFTVAANDSAGHGVSRELAIHVVQANAANFDGPAELPRTYIKSSLSDTPAPGATSLVKSGGDLQSALNSAKCGETIQLQAGATFTGSFVLPAKNCDDQHWIVVRTSAPDSALPPEGTRLTPCYAGVTSLPGRPSFACSSSSNVLAKLMFSDNGSGPIIMADGANHYRLLGLEVTRPVSSTTVYNLILTTQNGAADHIVFDRMWIHGTAQNETTRGIMLSGSTNVGVVDSFFSDFHCNAMTGACGDSQAIAGGLGDRAMGPYKIVNNYLEAAGENILFGGGAASNTPEDMEIRRNLFFKPLTWMKGQPNFVGGTDGQPFIVKNLFELKNGQRILLEGNVFDNSWGGFSQVGFALLLTPKNPSQCASCTVRDVTVRYSKFSHTGAAMQIGNGLSDTGFAAQEGSHYSIHDVVFDDMAYNGCTGCDGVMFQLTSEPKAPASFWLHDVSINHVTVASDRAHGGWIIAGPTGQQNFMFENSIIDSGNYANINAGGGAVQCYFGKDIMKGVLDSCWSHYTFADNVVIGNLSANTWPAGNFVVASGTAIGFVHWNSGIGGDYHLASSSPYKGKASDGKDPGADIDAVAAATAGVQ